MEYKGYEIKIAKGRMYEVKAIGRGSVPKELRGLYTSKHAAMSSIDFALSSKENNRARDKTDG